MIPYLWTQENFQTRCGHPPNTTDRTAYVVPNFAPNYSGDVCDGYSVISKELADQANSMVPIYNGIIADEVKLANDSGGHVIVLDLNRLVADMATNGIDIGQKHLTTAFLGGLFSLDGMHPSNSGYAIIANKAIDEMNCAWGFSIPRVNLGQVVATDPLVH